jgi:cell division protein ZipA
MDDSDEVLFSMANLTKPGSFDKSAWNALETIGVTMFMTLPGPLNALDAWDAMLATSRRIAELLHADLLDDKQDVFTRQREGQIREELREYERSTLAES